jgi:hypothetical protein
VGHPRLVRSATASAGVTLGTGSWRTSSANAVTTSWLVADGKGWTPQTGDALVRLAYLDNGSTVDPVSVTIGGHAVTVRDKADAGHGGTLRGCGVLLGTVRGLPTGAPLDVVAATSGAVGAGKLALRITDLAGWGGTVGGHDAAVVTGGAAVKQASSSVTLAGSDGLLVGIACVADADSQPLAAAGWTLTDDITLGTVAGTSIVAACFVRTGGDAGSSVALTATTGLGWSDFGVGALELL